MKKTSLLILGLFLSAITLAQAPNKMSFQTAVRNSQGKLVLNKSIGVRISILQSTSTGTPVYVETHTKSSNANGLLTLEVGAGIVATGIFSTIDWSQGPYFLKTEKDMNGGINYTISEVTEFVSEPYAMNSKNADNANSVKTLSNGSNVGDMCYWNGTTWVPLNKGTQGQSLTFCDGKPAWTFGGGCPGDVPVLNCSSATNNGILNATTAASGVTSVISYIGGNGGTHNGQVVSSTGVTGLTATLQAGAFANGNGSLTYTITGTPAASGTTSFALNIEGKTCTLTRDVLLPLGVISTLECSSATKNGTLTGTITASGVSSVISYTGGNGGTHNGQVVSSTGVTGLTATLQAGTFANGNGNLTFTINGTPVTSGTAIFALSIGGKTCTLTRNVLLPVGEISTLNCYSVNNGTLYATTAASGVTSVISYTGGNGGTYDGQVVYSIHATGALNGLIATLQAGNFANGAGSLTYTITGTYSTIGTASFVLNIGGQMCAFTRTVIQPTSGYGSNISDFEGNSYKTVYIGTQQWMGENLKASKYNDGTTIPNITNNNEWLYLETAGWSFYNNQAVNNAKYGKLYNWYAVSPGIKNVCPTGWHVPKNAEWTVLTDYLGGEKVAGGKMKEVGTTSWTTPNTNATNTSLFTGVPGGYRKGNDGICFNIGSNGSWWSSSEKDKFDAWACTLSRDYGNAFNYSEDKRIGYSVRCLRD